MSKKKYAQRQELISELKVWLACEITANDTIKYEMCKLEDDYKKGKLEGLVNESYLELKRKLELEEAKSEGALATILMTLDTLEEDVSAICAKLGRGYRNNGKVKL